MHYVLYLLYFSLILYLLMGRRWLSHPGLPKHFIPAVFVIKALMGLMYGLLHLHLYGGGDVFSYFNDSLVIYNLLFTQPLTYLELTFLPNNRGIPDHLAPYLYAMGFWGDTSAYLLVRINSFLNIFSFGNYYINNLLLNFVVLAALVKLYDFFCRSRISSRWVAVAIFLTPSALFWGSGSHKEALTLIGLGYLLWSLRMMMERGSFSRYLPLFMLFTFLVFYTREYIMMLLIPATIALCWTTFWPRRIILKFGAIYAIIILAAIIFPLPVTGLNLLELISVKQEAFESLQFGQSYVPVAAFQPDPLYLVKNAPFALYNSILRPAIDFPGNFWLQLLAAAETWLIFGFIIFLIYKYGFGLRSIPPAALFSLFFAVGLLLIIGYIVPNLGAIVRYRSVALPFLMVFFVGGLRHKT